MVLGKKVAIFDWEWTPREGQKMPCYLIVKVPLLFEICLQQQAAHCLPLVGREQHFLHHPMTLSL